MNVVSPLRESWVIDCSAGAPGRMVTLAADTRIHIDVDGDDGCSEVDWAEGRSDGSGELVTEVDEIRLVFSDSNATTL